MPAHTNYTCKFSTKRQVFVKIYFLLKKLSSRGIFFFFCLPNAGKDLSRFYCTIFCDFAQLTKGISISIYFLNLSNDVAQLEKRSRDSQSTRVYRDATRFDAVDSPEEASAAIKLTRCGQSYYKSPVTNVSLSSGKVLSCKCKPWRTLS